MRIGKMKETGRRIGLALLGLFSIAVLGIAGCSTINEPGGKGFAETGQLNKVMTAEPSRKGLKGRSTHQMKQEKAELQTVLPVSRQNAVPPGKGQPANSTLSKRILPKREVLPGQSRKPIMEMGKTDQGPPVHVELAFDNADLYEVLDATLYELFKVNYMVDPSLRAKVTFHLSGNYTKPQFINIFNNILQLNSLAIVKGPGNIYKVVRRSLSAGVSNAPLERGQGGKAVGDITRLIRLRYLSSAAAIKNLKPFLSKGAVITQDTVTNSVIITDTSDNIAKAADILGTLDVPYFTDISWRLFPVKEVDASDISKDLDTVLKAGGLYNRPGINKGSFQILPIKTMNAVLVVSRWPSILPLVEHWIGAMDHANESGTNVYVYFVQNGDATELADTLKQVYGASATKKSTKKTTIVKPAIKVGQQRISAEISGEVQIIPDKTNNAIVIKANNRDCKLIKGVLDQLDIVPRQVLIDVMVAEITLSGSVQYGVEWFLQGRTGGYTVQGALDNNVGRPINTPLGSSSGFTFAVYNPVNFMRGLMNALGSDADVNILSSPNILAVDNKEASIDVGEEVPTVTGEVTSATAGTTITNTVQYRKTGIILKVTPHINSSGLVKMDVYQEVSEKGEFNTALSSYSILSRKAETSLVAQDGQTIVIGGLMQSNRSASQAGVPFLRKIPVLGYLFGATKKEVKKTELIILITPHVINNKAQADAITREFSQRTQALKDFIQKNEK